LILDSGVELAQLSLRHPMSRGITRPPLFLCCAALIQVTLTSRYVYAQTAVPQRAADSTATALQAQVATATPYSDDFYAPRRHQLDLEISNFAGFPTDDSLIRRREASIAGSALHWGPDLGVTSYQQPGFNGTFWFDDLNALQFQFRYSRFTAAAFLPHL
jgi:hypothetical protein